MSDPISMSKSARESLSRGLNALQADPSVPAHLVDLAAPIAQAMGALHQLERNNQLAPHAEVALNHVRGALAQLQAAPPNHPAVTAALDAVAMSLTVVHALSRMAQGAAPLQPGAAAKPETPNPPPAGQPPPQQKPPTPPPKPATAPQPAAAPRPATAPQPAAAPKPIPQPVFSPAPGPAPIPQPAIGAGLAPTVPATHGTAIQNAPLRPAIPPGFASTAPIANRPASQPGFSQPTPQLTPQQQLLGQRPHTHPQPQPQPQPPPPQQQPQMVARDPFAAPARDPFAPSPAPAPGPKPATPSMPVPAPPAAGSMQLIPADLGAHSPTNFYKGLSGNDIIDHGGLFVSTYLYPKIGTPVRLKISLPGGYEFEANAVVKWTREQGGDAPPGFGARFTGITNEARQLIYRYVRNREPLFYDDL